MFMKIDILYFLSDISAQPSPDLHHEYDAEWSLSDPVDFSRPIP